MTIFQVIWFWLIVSLVILEKNVLRIIGTGIIYLSCHLANSTTALKGAQNKWKGHCSLCIICPISVNHLHYYLTELHSLVKLGLWCAEHVH